MSTIAYCTVVIMVPIKATELTVIHWVAARSVCQARLPGHSARQATRSCCLVMLLGQVAQPGCLVIAAMSVCLASHAKAFCLARLAVLLPGPDGPSSYIALPAWQFPSCLGALLPCSLYYQWNGKWWSSQSRGHTQNYKLSKSNQTLTKILLLAPSQAKSKFQD